MSFYQENRREQNNFYKSTRWRKCRAAYLSEHPICERCAAAGIVSVAEHVHHRIELEEDNYLDPIIALNPDNLEALCFECHQKEHHRAQEVGKDFYFDSKGDYFKK